MKEKEQIANWKYHTPDFVYENENLIDWNISIDDFRAQKDVLILLQKGIAMLLQEIWWKDFEIISSSIKKTRETHPA